MSNVEKRTKPALVCNHFGVGVILPIHLLCPPLGCLFSGVFKFLVAGSLFKVGHITLRVFVRVPGSLLQWIWQTLPRCERYDLAGRRAGKEMESVGGVLSLIVDCCFHAVQVKQLLNWGSV